MTMFRRPAAATCVLTLTVLAGVSSAYPQWAEEAGLDFWNVSALENSIEDGKARIRELDAELGRVTERRCLKDALALDLIEGRADLRATAERFARVGVESASDLARLKLAYRVSDDRAVRARQAMEYAWQQLNRRGDAETWTRLVSEYRAAYPEEPFIN